MLGTALAYIAPAFFIDRISFAAAIAAGEASLSGGGFCCAPAGTMVRASPNARAAADKILEKHFIPDSPEIAALQPFNNAYSVGACQHRRARKTDEQPVLDNARDQGQQARQTRSIGYASQMGIDNPVAAIGDKNVAVFALSDHHLPGNAAFRKCPAHASLRRRQAERNDLDRQRKAAENFNPFGIVG